MESFTIELKNNEKIIYRATQHWAILLGPLIVIFIGWLMLDSKPLQAYAVLVFGIIWGTSSFISLHKSDITLTDSRLLINLGFPLKKSFDIPLNNIKLFDFYQPSLGSILNFGKIILVLNENKKKAFRFISSPAELVREVHKQAIKVRENKKAGS